MDGGACAAEQINLATVGGVDEMNEAEIAKAILEFMGWEVGEKDGGGPVDVIRQPRFVEVIAVNMRDVQIIGRLDSSHQFIREPVVTREHTP